MFAVLKNVSTNNERRVGYVPLFYETSTPTILQSSDFHRNDNMTDDVI